MNDKRNEAQQQEYEIDKGYALISYSCRRTKRAEKDKWRRMKRREKRKKEREHLKKDLCFYASVCIVERAPS